jgi:hypothetical protein
MDINDAVDGSLYRVWPVLGVREAPASLIAAAQNIDSSLLVGGIRSGKMTHACNQPSVSNQLCLSTTMNIANSCRFASTNDDSPKLYTVAQVR